MALHRLPQLRQPRTFVFAAQCLACLQHDAVAGTEGDCGGCWRGGTLGPRGAGQQLRQHGTKHGDGRARSGGCEPGGYGWRGSVHGLNLAQALPGAGRQTKALQKLLFFVLRARRAMAVRAACSASSAHGRIPAGESSASAGGV